MTPQAMALYAMTVLGFTMGAAAVFIAITQNDPEATNSKWRSSLLCVFAVALLGVGAFGPSFLGDYSKFLKELASLDGEQRDAAYQKLVDDMATGKMPKECRPLAQAYMLEHPTPALEEAIDAGIAKAKPSQVELLTNLKLALKRKAETADLALKGATAHAPTPAARDESLRTLDDASLVLLAKKPKLELETFKLDPALLDRMIEERRPVR